MLLDRSINKNNTIKNVCFFKFCAEFLDFKIRKFNNLKIAKILLFRRKFFLYSKIQNIAKRIFIRISIF
jgi:hypothetical protein